MFREKRKFIQVNEVKFINEFKKFKFLYDSSDLNYRNLEKRNEAWDSISNEVGITAAECRKRWRSLRDNYQKAVKANLDDNKKWIHFDMVDSFYGPFSGKNLAKKIKTENEEHDDFVDPQDYLAEPVNEIYENPLAIKSEDVNETSSSQNGKCDSDEAFLLSCAPILRRLPSKKNVLARLKIQQILFELEFDDKYCAN